MPACKKVHEPFNLKDDKLPTASSEERQQFVMRLNESARTKVALGSGALKTEHSVNSMSETPKHIAIITGASSGLGLEFVRQLNVRSSVTRADVGVHHIDEFWLVARTLRSSKRSPLICALLRARFQLTFRNRKTSIASKRIWVKRTAWLPIW